MGREAGTPAWGGRCRAASSGGGAWSVFRSRRLTEPPLAACLGRGFYAQPLKSGRKMHQGKKEPLAQDLDPARAGPTSSRRGDDPAAFLKIRWGRPHSSNGDGKWLGLSSSSPVCSKSAGPWA